MNWCGSESNLTLGKRGEKGVALEMFNPDFNHEAYEAWLDIHSLEVLYDDSCEKFYRMNDTIHPELISELTHLKITHDELLRRW